MILRIWHGWTTPGNADSYEALLTGEVIPSIEDRNIDGFHGMEVYRRSVDNEVEFVVASFFDTVEALRAFVGEDCEVAYIPDKARAVLSRWDDRCRHYDARTPLAAVRTNR